jgi:MinD-like ATPase involved in chromosome partitioning or flagellar assembly
MTGDDSEREPPRTAPWPDAAIAWERPDTPGAHESDEQRVTSQGPFGGDMPAASATARATLRVIPGRPAGTDATTRGAQVSPWQCDAPAHEPAALPELADQPLNADPHPLRPDGWWRRARSTLRATPEDFQHRLTTDLLHCLRRPLAPLSVPYVVAATSLKGGVGKRTVTACLGLTLARHRADRVLAADLNMHAGTLSDRLIPGIPRATVQHLLDDLLDGETPVNAIGDVDRYIDVADRLSVLAGDKDPSVGAAFAEDDVSELLTCLGRFYHLVLADCGTGIADDAMQAVLRETDTLILVATPTPDAAGLAEETLTWLDTHGHPQLVENSIAVLSGPSPAHRVESRTRFRDRCRAVIDIPSDPYLAQGRVITLEALADNTRHAYLTLAAAVMDAAPAPTRPSGSP